MLQRTDGLTPQSSRWLRAAIAQRTHPKTAIGVLSFGALWAALVLWLYLCGAAASEWQAWFELFNGATWPEGWERLQVREPLWFAVSLATRSIVNIAGPIGLLVGAIWFIRGGLENFMKMSLVELLRMHNVELVSNLALLLKARHPSAFTSEDEEAMQNEAKRFLAEWQSELPKDAAEGSKP